MGTVFGGGVGLSQLVGVSQGMAQIIGRGLPYLVKRRPKFDSARIGDACKATV